MEWFCRSTVASARPMDNLTSSRSWDKAKIHIHSRHSQGHYTKRQNQGGASCKHFRKFIVRLRGCYTIHSARKTKLQWPPCAPSSNLIKASFRELQLEFRLMPSWSTSLLLRASSMKLGVLGVFRDGGADPKPRGPVRPSCTSTAGGSTGARHKRFAIWQAISLLVP